MDLEKIFFIATRKRHIVVFHSSRVPQLLGSFQQDILPSHAALDVLVDSGVTLPLQV